MDILRLDKCVKDEHGQPLVCYGCAHSAAYTTYYGTGQIVENTDFPGVPSGERPCFLCIRNPEREQWQKDFADGNRGRKLDTWYDFSKPIKLPMDCYHTCDMKEQINVWLGHRKPRKLSLIQKIKNLFK